MQQAQPAPLSGLDNDSRQENRTRDGYSERLDGNGTMAGLGRKGGPLLDPKGKPLQPFTILDKRSQMRNGVFRPGHNLPTMSIDEYLDEEKRRGGIIEGGGNANESAPEPDEDNIAEVDAATMKAREWDEFVEANPKGAGNTLNRG
jgi:immunoglobulin-binding protein 1